jgi:hypothetical protein
MITGLLDSEMNLARLSNTNIVGPLAASPDTMQVPSGDFIGYAVTTLRKLQDANSLLVSGTPFRLSEFANLLRANLPAGSSVEFSSTQFGRP